MIRTDITFYNKITVVAIYLLHIKEYTNTTVQTNINEMKNIRFKQASIFIRKALFNFIETKFKLTIQARCVVFCVERFPRTITDYYSWEGVLHKHKQVFEEADSQPITMDYHRVLLAQTRLLYQVVITMVPTR